MGERRYDLNPTFSNRTRNCTCCDQRKVRDHVTVGTPGDPDYVVAVCPNCDTVSTLRATTPAAG